MEKKNRIVGALVKSILLMYVVTGILLLLLAVFMYNLDLSVKTAEIVIVLIYIVVGFCGGFFIGKQLKTRKFLWGVLAGLLYFGILVIVSLAVGGGKVEDAVQLLIRFVLCTASAMIGGMVS